MTEPQVDRARRIALLRGVNVGGHRKVPMAELRDVLTDRLDVADVATYIQSGNVVFTDTDTGSGPFDRAAAMEVTATAMSAVIADHFGHDVPVVVRDATLLPTLLDRAAELFPDDGSDTHDRFVMIGFLTAEPTPEAVGAIDPDRSPGDEVVVDGQHAYVRYAAGQSSTKLTGDHLERVLGVGMTLRNLRTVRKLVELA